MWIYRNLGINKLTNIPESIGNLKKLNELEVVIVKDMYKTKNYAHIEDFMIIHWLAFLILLVISSH